MARRKVSASAPRFSFLAWLREQWSLPRIETWSTTLRTVFINGLFLLVVIVVVPLLVTQFRRGEVVIEPIAVPEALAAQGMTSEVAANRVWDGLHDVHTAARTAKESLTSIPDGRRVEFSFPDSGFSIESLVFHVRKLFNVYETRIAGEIICADAECAREGLRLRLRLVRDRVDIIDLPAIGTETDRHYFADGASGILALLDPFVALAADVEKNPLRATILARRLIRTQHPDAKWAHNLIGLIRLNAGEHAAAVTEFRAAIGEDPDFLIARGNLADALREAGDLAAAKAELAELQRRDTDNLEAETGLARLAQAQGDPAEAVRHYLRAADLDPLSPLYLAKAGEVEIKAGRTAEGEALLYRALEIDPGYPLAFATLASMQVGRGDYAAAEKVFRDAADYAPDDAEAQMSHGRVLAVLKDWPGALQRLERAVALDPASADYKLQAAQALQRLGRQEDSLKVLEDAAKLEPANGAVYMALGDGYRELGRKDEATAAYRKFLELDKDSVMRVIAQRYIELP